MKTINSYLLALMSFFMLTWTACSDSVDYNPAETLQGQGAFFTAASASYKVEDASGTVNLQIFRSTENGSVEVPLKIEYADGADVAVQVPAAVNFADGEVSAVLPIQYSNLEMDKSYKLNISVEDATPYGIASVAVSLLYSTEPVYTWEVVSEKAVYFDQLFEFIGMTGIKTAGIVVEKAKEGNFYRFKSPYDNDYFMKTWGGKMFPDDYEYNYIILDGETYKNAKNEPLYYIKPTNLGFLTILSGNQVSVDNDEETQIFGSIAGNLSTADGPIPPTSTDFPLGTYDEKKQAFNLGAVFHKVEGHGYRTLKAGTFMLYLDPAALVPDYDKDYTWVPLLGSGGYFKSELMDETWIQSLQQSAEDPTFFRLPDLYAQGTPFYFNLDEANNSVTVLKGQKSGLTTFGNEVYIEATPGKSSYDAENGLVTLGLTFYIADENGKKVAVLKEVIEKFNLGTEAEDLQSGKTIDEYVGTRVLVATNGAQGGNIPVNIVKKDDKTLAIQGLVANLFSLPQPVDDTVYANYDAASGFISIASQRVAALDVLDGDGGAVYLSLFNSAESSITQDKKEELVGGINSEGVIKFINSSSNKAVWDALTFIAEYVEGDKKSFGLLTGWWYQMDSFYPYQRLAKTAKFSATPMSSFAPVSQEVVARRTYKTELNIKPVPVTVNVNTDMTRQLVETEAAEVLYR